MTQKHADVKFPNGQSVAPLGQGSWYMGEHAAAFQREVKALQFGLDLGLNLIDTAEMYADGGAEKVVGAAIAGRRDQAFLVSKVLPYNASRNGTIAACERSLRRLNTDHIDLYLLHWRGSYPLRETLDAFEELQMQGKIAAWGVSNFDVADMQELSALARGPQVATNQVLYNLSRRGPEFDLLPWCADHNIPVMAYSPVEQGRILGHAELNAIAAELDVSAAATALAWAIRSGNVIAIPKSSDINHLTENRKALDIILSPQQLSRLDAVFKAPTRKLGLEML